MKQKIKQNKNNLVIRFLSLSIVFIFLFSSFCSFAFATDLNSDFIIVSTDSDNPTAIVSYTNNDGSGYGTIYTESETPVYVCTYGNFYTGYKSLSGGTTRGFIVFSSAPFTVQWKHGLADFAESSSSSGDFYIIDDYIALNAGQSILVNASLPYFDTKNDALSAIDSFLDNPPSPGSLTGEFTYSLPAGNVIFIDVTNLNVSVDLSQTTPLSYWGLGSTQYSGVTNSLPSSLSLPIAGTSIISWTGSGKADTFGKFSNWVSHATVSGISSDHNHVYYVVANPLNNNSTAGSGYDVSSIANGNISIHISNSNSVKIYQLETSFNAGVYDSDSAGDTMTGHNNGSGGLDFINDTTGNPDNPSFGGMTTPESQASTIHDFLQNISTQISGFFSGAIGAVSTLVSAGRDFMQSVSGLYSWLPAPVYTVLTSAIILVITIGVIKVFI